MSLFDGEPLVNKPKSKIKYPVVISASRMTDMPKYYPNKIIEAIEAKINADTKIHTLVLWTKHPESLLAQPLHVFLEKLKKSRVQLFLQCTITGLGQLVVGKTKEGRPLILEPNSPTSDQAISSLPKVIALLGDPRRINLRIDPIVRIRPADDKIFSSLKLMPPIIKEVSNFGVQQITFSFLEKGVHQKVDKRFKELGVEIIPPSIEERESTVNWLKQIEEKYKVSIGACCVPGMPETKCIDGTLLQRLHDDGLSVNLSEPRKREMCGCTHSIDIGGWPPSKCYTGCQYCYANSSYF